MSSKRKLFQPKSYLKTALAKAKLELHMLCWKDALWRMAVDVVTVNGSMLLSILIWHVLRPLLRSTGSIPVVPKDAAPRMFLYIALWSVLALTVFYLSGFYTRTRRYATQYKALVIFRAVTLLAGLFVLTEYWLIHGNLVSRPVTFFAWIFMLATVGGLRFAKDSFFGAYKLERRFQNGKNVGRVFVVGGAGYLGSVLVPMLLERGYQVRLLDSFLYGESSLSRVQNNPRLEIISGDLRDIQSVVHGMKDCDAVIHLAAIVGDPACEENKDLAIEVNRIATRMLIDVARGYGVRRFLFASTCSIYGASDYLMDEHTAVAPVSVYANTKLDSEKLLLQATSPDFHPTILRLGTLFGHSPRPRLDLVVNLLTARAACEKKITIFNGHQWRPFLHVSDAARAFIMCLKADPTMCSGQIFNVGSYDLNHQLTDVSKEIARIIPCLEICHVENGDRRNYRVSFDKIHSRLGFQCEKTLEDGIRELQDWIGATKLSDVMASQFNNQIAMRTIIQANLAQRAAMSVRPGGIEKTEILGKTGGPENVPAAA